MAEQKDGRIKKRPMACFMRRWNNEDWNYTPPTPTLKDEISKKIKKKERKRCSDIRQQCRTVFSDRRDASYLSLLSVWREFPASSMRKENQAKPVGLLEFGGERWDLLMTKTTRVCSPECQREKNYRARAPEICILASLRV